MGFRITLTSLILANALVFALSAWAQQKNVGPSSAGPRPNAVRPYVACASAGWRRAVFQALRLFGGLLERYFNFGIAARFGLGHCLGNPVKMQPHNPPGGVPQFNNGDFAAR